MLLFCRRRNSREIATLWLCHLQFSSGPNGLDFISLMNRMYSNERATWKLKQKAQRRASLLWTWLWHCYRRLSGSESICLSEPLFFIYNVVLRHATCPDPDHTNGPYWHFSAAGSLRGRGMHRGMRPKFSPAHSNSHSASCHLGHIRKIPESPRLNRSVSLASQNLSKDNQPKIAAACLKCTFLGSSQTAWAEYLWVAWACIWNRSPGPLWYIKMWELLHERIVGPFLHCIYFFSILKTCYLVYRSLPLVLLIRMLAPLQCNSDTTSSTKPSWTPHPWVLSFSPALPSFTLSPSAPKASLMLHHIIWSQAFSRL